MDRRWAEGFWQMDFTETSCQSKWTADIVTWIKNNGHRTSPVTHSGSITLTVPAARICTLSAWKHSHSIDFQGLLPAMLVYITLTRTSCRHLLLPTLLIVKSHCGLYTGKANKSEPSAGSPLFARSLIIQLWYDVQWTVIWGPSSALVSEI